MGDRVLIQIKSNNEVSPVCYLHWGGSDAPEIIRECAALMGDRTGDVPYTFGRLVGIAHTKIEGRWSLGVWNQAKELTDKDSHGDAGCYVVDCDTWEVKACGGYGHSFCAT